MRYLRIGKSRTGDFSCARLYLTYMLHFQGPNAGQVKTDAGPSSFKCTQCPSSVPPPTVEGCNIANGYRCPATTKTKLNGEVDNLSVETVFYQASDQVLANTLVCNFGGQTGECYYPITVSYLDKISPPNLPLRRFTGSYRRST